MFSILTAYILIYDIFDDKYNATYLELKYLQENMKTFVHKYDSFSIYDSYVLTNLTSLSSIPLQKDIDTHFKLLQKDTAICPITGTHYIFSPITPSGKVLSFPNANSPTLETHYFYLWTPPGALRRDRFVFLTLRGGRWYEIYEDCEVSWYYQLPLSYLTDDQIQKEKQYRAENGLKPINEERRQINQRLKTGKASVWVKITEHVKNVLP